MKDIKDYLHLYLGCECEVSGLDDYEDNGIDGRGKLTKVDILGDDILCTIEDTSKGYCSEVESEFVKPILRSLYYMTQDEGHELNWGYRLGCGVQRPQTLTPNEFMYLLSKGFDLFNLIEENLAIDKNSL